MDCFIAADVNGLVAGALLLSMVIGAGTAVFATFAGALHVYDVVHGWYSAAKRERERAARY
jgi:uncharacterized membrane protein YczE